VIGSIEVMTYTRAPVAIALLLASACSRPTKDAVPPPGPTVELTVDDGDTTAVTMGSAARPLAAVVGPQPAAWLEVRASTADGRDLELTRPATKYPDAEVRLYMDQGRPALGVFRHITADMPADIQRIARQPIVALAGVAEVTVRTQLETFAPLTIRLEGRDQVITESLRTLRLHPSRKPRERGWELGAILALAVPPDRAITAVRLHTKDGTAMPLDVALVRNPSAVLKRNRHGEYVFRMWDTKPTLELRGVTLIEIE